MKAHPKIVALTLFLMLPTLGICADNTPQGTYVPRIVLTAPWGKTNLRVNKVPSEPGTFGFRIDEEGIEHGPTAFTIAPNGDIYIADNINDRTQHFSASGQFISIIPNVRVGYDSGLRVDKEGNIYTGHFYTLNPYVKKFNPQGNLLITYPVSKDDEMGTDDPAHWGGQGNILVDDSGRIFVQYLRGNFEYSFQVGTKDATFGSAQQKTSWKQGFYGLTANLPNGNQRYSGDILGLDSLYEYEMEKDEKNENISIITKYQNGKLVGTYTLDWKQIECPILTAFSMGGRQVFDKGNIYVFCSDKEGIKIIKWSPVGGSK
ncbi:MAG: hypothetical protein MUP17_00125 [candidate division Zixibacteria bacterium]|nr:hypothetical protein [candidate division Zixibacteria bacterium]